MKRRSPAIALLTLCNLLTAAPVHADNADVENALKRRPDLSSFYAALVNTGVNHELQPGARYSVFAPTNAAMARVRQDQYPCFYMTECRAQVADIVRNHIVPGEVYIKDAAHHQGGIYAINHRFITVGEPFRHDYAVDGQNVVYMSWFGDGILYKVDGVIASPREMAALQFPEYVYAEPAHEITTVTRKVIPETSCGPEGCPDSTTITHTIVAPYPPQSLAPAAGR